MTETKRKLIDLVSELEEEMTADEEAAMSYRCEIARAAYDIKSIAILNYIYTIVLDVHKEAQEQGLTYGDSE